VWEQDILLSPTSAAWGTAAGTTINGVYTCTGGPCNLVQSDFPMQPVNDPAHIAHGEGDFGTTVTTGSGAVGFPAHRLDWWFYGPGYGQSTNGSAQWSTARCDDTTAGVPAGCANPFYTPYLIFSENTNPLVGPVAEHIYNAQKTLPSHWGVEPAGKPLTRTTDDQVRNDNRRIACVGVPPSCDEFPFASTWEGAAAPHPATAPPSACRTAPKTHKAASSTPSTSKPRHQP